MQVQSIKIADITVPEGRLRDIDPEWAQALAGMFAEVGHKTPIDVAATETGFELVAGGHRLAAARLCKWKTIEARVLEPTGAHRAEELRLHEVLENLARKDFTALERCEALAELKRIYEALHPETKHGGDRKSQATKNKAENQEPIFGFCQNAAQSTGLSLSAVKLAVQIFEGLSRESRERLKGTALAQKQSELKALAALDAGLQKTVLDLIFVEPPQAGSTAEALMLIDGKRPPSPTDRLFRTVSDSLIKLPRASRSAVFRQHKAEILALAKRENWFDA
ncbi:ParB/RepB/Spo0J family partition protein [Polymorphum gilvum]|uniref:ParB-like nuclease domain protein n=1 Tax=Polymorphum gilvum (strain LMG 25793 / CGMCC 1.9160 / SL003B-26A1) TaxID=991905 RepID=F2J544_POLGS|nr:ParB N-terminal domain-containing protein [Polymorphum gilvum]ADZ70086.1 ParB-like nuclease domain protein [Polymorphum gilvum SL003B-26A1]